MAVHVDQRQHHILCLVRHRRLWLRKVIENRKYRWLVPHLLALEHSSSKGILLLIFSLYMGSGVAKVEARSHMTLLQRLWLLNEPLRSFAWRWWWHKWLVVITVLLSLECIKPSRSPKHTCFGSCGGAQRRLRARTHQRSLSLRHIPTTLCATALGCSVLPIQLSARTSGSYQRFLLQRSLICPTQRLAWCSRSSDLLITIPPQAWPTWTFMQVCPKVFQAVPSVCILLCSSQRVLLQHCHLPDLPKSGLLLQAPLGSLVLDQLRYASPEDA
mmetsp:Transcript_7860/g.17279  ORF Transcript_7860/g.17279 Transcript_7860/m.17279 type:complete len:272 (+) Transcript_7860:1830-2645(+)